MFKIQTYNKIDPAGLQRLSLDEFEVAGVLDADSTAVPGEVVQLSMVTITITPMIMIAIQFEVF